MHAVTRSLPRLDFVARLLWLPLLIMVALLQGCADLNPVAVAQTPDQKYDAILLTYNAVLETATPIVSDVTVPPDVRRALQNAIGASGQIYSAANQAYQEYKTAKAALAAGTSTPEKVTIAAANLEKWSGQLDGALAQLKTLTSKK